MVPFCFHQTKGDSIKVIAWEYLQECAKTVFPITVKAGSGPNAHQEENGWINYGIFIQWNAIYKKNTVLLRATCIRGKTVKKRKGMINSEFKLVINSWGKEEGDSRDVHRMKVNILVFFLFLKLAGGDSDVYIIIIYTRDQPTTTHVSNLASRMLMCVPWANNGFYIKLC